MKISNEQLMVILAIVLIGMVVVHFWYLDQVIEKPVSGVDWCENEYYSPFVQYQEKTFCLLNFWNEKVFIEIRPVGNDWEIVPIEERGEEPPSIEITKQEFSL